MDLSSLASSLQTSTRLTKAEKDLMEKFRAAALSITTLYKSSLSTSKRAYSAGYSACLSDVLQMIQHGLSTEQETTDGMANLMTIGRVMDWVEARQETIRLEEEDGDVNDDSGGEGAPGGSSTAHGAGRTTAKAAAADGGAVSGADGRMNARATSHPHPTSAAGQPSSFASSSRQTSTGPPPPSPPPAVPPPTAFANAAAGSSSSSSPMTVHAPPPAYPVSRPHSSTALDRPRRLASSPITPSSSPVQHAPSTSSTPFPPVSPLVTRRKPPSQPLPSSLSHSLDVNGPSSSSSSSTFMSTSDPATSSSSFAHVPQSNFSFSLPPSTTTTTSQSAFGGHPSTALLPRPPPPPPSTNTSDKDSSVVLPSKRRFAALLPPQPSTTSSGSNDETMDDAASSGGTTSTSSSAGGGGGGQNDRQSRRKGRRGATRVSEGRQGGLADVIEHVGQEGDEREKKRVTRR